MALYSSKSKKDKTLPGSPFCLAFSEYYRVPVEDQDKI